MVESKKPGAAIKAAYVADPEKSRRLSERVRVYFAKGNKQKRESVACMCAETGKVYPPFMAEEKEVEVDYSAISR